MGVLVSVLYSVNILCIIFVIFFENKRAQATIAWVLIMSFLPIIGAVIYLLLGSSLIPPLSKRIKKHVKNHEQYINSFKKYLDLNKIEIENNKEQVVRKFNDLIMLNANQNQSLYSDDNDITIFIDAKEKYKYLFEDIENAKHTINVEYFIIRNDEIGKEFINLLSKKASQGVTVNLIYDELGSLNTTLSMFKPLIASGGNVCRFFTTISSNLIRFNHRNHRKIVVIDGRIAYTGGMNIGMEYMGLSKLKPWRDTHIRIIGSAVFSLQVRFLLDFITSSKKNIEVIEHDEYKKYFPETEFDGKSGIQIISSGPDSQEQEIKNNYIKMINSAKSSIYIQTPYFVPDEPLLEALKLASLSGVKVNFMIPGKADKIYVYYITMSYIEDILNYGINVYLYDGFLHSKVIVVDSQICSIGTTNFDIRSFVLNFEVNAVIYDERFSKKCVEIFKNDMKNSELIKKEEFLKRNILKRGFERILRLFSPLA